jgi:hypothetical protein
MDLDEKPEKEWTGYDAACQFRVSTLIMQIAQSLTKSGFNVVCLPNQRHQVFIANNCPIGYYKYWIHENVLLPED